MCIKAIANDSKLTHYLSDGTGRDTYINNFNGGMWRQNQCQLIRPESGTFSKENRYRSPAPRINAKINRYRTNGSGRDGYIRYSTIMNSVDEGGFQVSDGRKQNFISALRCYETKVRSRKSNNSPALLQFSQTAFVTKRLHYSKQAEDPYQSIRKLTRLYYKK